MRRSPLGRLMRWMEGLMLKHVPMMITCGEFEDFIADYVDGALSDRQRRVFELHMRVCRECRDYLAAYRCTMEIAKRAYDDPEGPVPDEVPEDLIKAVLAARDT